MTDAYWLPIAFMMIMALAMLLYVILDGYDLGVGILSRFATDHEKDIMIKSIGPFWDANETWLVLGVGILLVAFPVAHGLILGALYLPVTIMLIGLILRGVAYEFRQKAPSIHKQRWNQLFFYGSLIASASQGYMLGSYITGFENNWWTILFSVTTALSVIAGYCLLGAGWLILKTHKDLQRRAAHWASASLWLTALGIAMVSFATPMLDERIFTKWFAFPEILLLAPIPLMTCALLVGVGWYARLIQYREVVANWLPLVFTSVIFLLCFNGLAYSFFPYIVPEQLTIWDAASATESLWIIFIGACVVVPMIFIYTVMSYVIFWGKTTQIK